MKLKEEMAALAQLDSKITLDNIRDYGYIIDSAYNSTLTINGEQYKINANIDDLRALELRVQVLENKLKNIEEQQQKYKIIYGE